MHTNSVICLNKQALQNNIAFLKNHFEKNVILSSVVKGNAYGHGVKEFVVLANDCGINHFSVFDSEEAKIVKNELKNKASVLIMGFISDNDLEWAIENEVEFFVFDQKRLLSAVFFSKKANKKAKIHIEIETGMNRTGFHPTALPWVMEILKKEEKHLNFKGLCTHFAGAESMVNYERIQKQIVNFEEAYQKFLINDLKPEIKHTACSAASMIFPETRMDLVRIGIMQYGLWSSPEVMMHYLNSQKSKIDPLKRIISWKSEVMNTKVISAGEFIGYGNSFMATEKMKVAIIPIGYSHGYSRSLSNHGYVLIQGKRCTILGTVNMNMITVDVTNFDKINIGEEVVLIGSQGESTITIASFSEYSNQLNYEMLTRISKSIPRKII